jgi:two-component system, OmpR family, osmolarity sensor histidine kinase EnvZ
MTRWLPRSIFGRTMLLVGLSLLTLAVSYVLVVRGLLVSEASAYTAELAALRFERAVAELPQPGGGVLVANEAPQERAATRVFRRGAIFDRYEKALRARLGADVDIRLDAPDERLWLRSKASQGLWLGLPSAFPLQRFSLRAIVAAALALLGAAALATAFASQMTRPLRELAHWAREGGDDPVPTIAGAGAAREAQELATALAAMQTKLAANEREREILLAGISHDVRTPLARVRLRVEMLDKPAEQGIELERDFDELDSVVEQFVVYARGADSEPQVRLSLDELTRDIARSHGDVVLDLRAPQVIALRRTAGERCVRNLLENAARYGRAPVGISTYLDHDTAVLVVSDHGPGIAANERARALTPFTRLQHGSTVTGAGLGLAIVQRLMRSDGGHVVFSEGVGGRFEVQLRWPAT